MGLTLEQWGIVYSMLMSTGGAAWQGASLWRNRSRLSIELRTGAEQKLEFSTGIAKTTFSADVVIRNRGPKEIRVESWHVEPTGKAGPFVIFGNPLPVTLAPYDEVAVTKVPPEMFLNSPKRYYAVDGRGKKWKCSRKQLRLAVKRAKEVLDANADPAKYQRFAGRPPR